MATSKTETIEVQKGPTQADFDVALEKTRIMVNPKDNEYASICSCCGTTNPTNSGFQITLREGYAKMHKFIHWVHNPKGVAALPKEKENTLVLRDESGESMVIGWGDYK